MRGASQAPILPRRVPSSSSARAAAGARSTGSGGGPPGELPAQAGGGAGAGIRQRRERVSRSPPLREGAARFPGPWFPPPAAFPPPEAPCQTAGSLTGFPGDRSRPRRPRSSAFPRGGPAGRLSGCW